MKAKKVDIDALIFTLNKFIEEGVDYIDIEVTLYNIIKLSPSSFEVKTNYETE